MGQTIAIAGKGGTGKSTLAGLLVREFRRRGVGPLLAVDADPNSNLADKLGMAVAATIGDVREETLSADFRSPTGIPKERRLEYAVQEAIVESNGCDLLVMGRPEGPGCYCYVNNLLRDNLARLSQGYERVVIDNEAGMEHLSRHSNGKVDVLLVVSDPTPVGLRAAANIRVLKEKLGLQVPHTYLILMRTRNGLDERVERELAATGIEPGGRVPEDEAVVECTLDDRPLVTLPDAAPAAQAVAEIVARLEL